MIIVASVDGGPETPAPIELDKPLVLTLRLPLEDQHGVPIPDLEVKLRLEIRS